MGTGKEEEEEGGSSSRKWYSSMEYDKWVLLPVNGPRPSPRYQQAAAVRKEKMYITGGTRYGRHLSDIQVLDMSSCTWSRFHPQGDSFPPLSSHHMFFWDNKLLSLLPKSPSSPSSSLSLRFLDLDTQLWGLLPTTGDLPVAREGESVTLLDSKLILFGGEDIHHNLLNDVHILHLDSMSWEKVQTTQPPPSPRYDHAAAIHSERYLLVFGGSSLSTCFNDLYLLDLHTMEWSQPETRGDFVAPRAGHSGVTVDGNWYIVGGGDNKRGANETLVLDMTTLVWSVVATVSSRDPLASEGISLCSASIGANRYLIAFGGYNGKYNNEVFVMRPKLKDSVRPKIYQSPAAAAAAASVSAAYSIGSGKHLDFAKVKETDAGVTTKSQQDGFADTDGLKDRKKLLESSLVEVRGENSLLKEKIDHINSIQSELSKELESVQGQLVAERSRCFNLEAQIAKLQVMLDLMPSREVELQSLRQEKSIVEQAVDRDKTVQMQGSRRVWQWFSGGGSSP